MKWWELIGLFITWLVGLYLRGKMYESKYGYKQNDNRKGKKQMHQHLFYFILQMIKKLYIFDDINQLCDS